MQIFVRFVVSLVFLISGPIIFGTPVFGIDSSTISINLGTLPSLDLTPGSFGSVSQSIDINTNNYTGYTVSLSNPIDSTDMINSADDSLTIPTITLPSGSTSITEDDFESGYGISVDGTNYLPALNSTNKILIGSSDTSGTSSYNLTFGAKPNPNTVAGSYSKTFIVEAIVKSPQFSITYDANAGSDTVTDMPSNQSVTVSDTGTVTLPNDVPTRTGYIFLGWDEDGNATTPTYTIDGANTITLDPTQANDISLYAIWQSDSAPGTSEVVHPDGSRTRTTIDEDGNKFIQEISASGVVTEYHIDTTASGGYTITYGNSLDTELIPFDGNAFTIHIVFKADLSQNNNKFIVGAMNKDGNYYNGMSLFAFNNNYFRTAIYKNRTRSSSTGLITANSYIGLNASAMSGDTFDITITYDPKGYNNNYAELTASLVGGNSGSQHNSSSSSNIPTNLPDATITLGGNGIDLSDDVSLITIMSFEVIKTISE